MIITTGFLTGTAFLTGFSSSLDESSDEDSAFLTLNSNHKSEKF
jgi:hypothetical protein